MSDDLKQGGSGVLMDIQKAFIIASGVDDFESGAPFCSTPRMEGGGGGCSTLDNLEKRVFNILKCSDK